MQAAMRRVWPLYEASRPALNELLRERLASHPAFARLVRDTPPDPEADARQAALVGAAMREGEWEPYWATIRTQAAGYANAEIAFASWVELVQMVRAALLERLFASGSDHLQSDVAAIDRWLDDALAVFGQAFVDANEQVIARQQRAIRQLSTPVLQLRPGLLLLPIVGSLDEERITQLRSRLLDGVRDRRARVVVLDVTGVPAIDSVVANLLMGAVSSARLMGAELIVSGLSAEIAQTLVHAGIDLSAVESVGDLQSGIERAERLLEGRSG
jgi:anti-anti-sigma regulatory factor